MATSNIVTNCLCVRGGCRRRRMVVVKGAYSWTKSALSTAIKKNDQRRREGFRWVVRCGYDRDGTETWTVMVAGEGGMWLLAQDTRNIDQPNNILMFELGVVVMTEIALQHEWKRVGYPANSRSAYNVWVDELALWNDGMSGVVVEGGLWFVDSDEF